MALSRVDRFTYKRIANGLYRAMAASALAMREKYPGKKYYSDYGKLALTTRPNWKQVSDTQFQYKGHAALNVADGDSIVSIINGVFSAEVYHTYEPGVNTDRYLEICEYGKSIFDKK